MTVTFRLMQESGVTGPVKTFEMENPDPHPNALRRLAREWASGETGHPWDVLTVEYGDQCIEVNQN
jgi:hypothetical protein